MIIFIILISILFLVKNFFINEFEINIDKCYEKNNKNCKLIFNNKIKLKYPIFFHIKINKIYQTNRLTLNDYDSKQLQGRKSTDKLLCKKYLKDKNDKFINPCGLLAFLYPDLKITNIKNLKNKKKIKVSSKNIVQRQIKEKFKKNKNENQWTNVKDENFISWMKINSLSDNYKLTGIMNENNLEIGEYEINLKINNLNKQIVKSIIISNGNYWTYCFGGKNYWISIILFILSFILFMNLVVIHEVIKKSNKKLKLLHN